MPDEDDLPATLPRIKTVALGGRGWSARRVLNLLSVILIGVLLLGTLPFWFPIGLQLANTAFPPPPTATPRPYLGPLLYAREIGGDIMALRPDTGTLMWRVPLSAVSMLVLPDQLLITQWAMKGLVSLERRSGHQQWQIATPPGFDLEVLGTAGQIAIVRLIPTQPAQNQPPMPPQLRGLDRTTGTTRWTWAPQRGDWMFALLAPDGTLLLADSGETPADNGQPQPPLTPHLFAVDSQTGQIRWQHDVLGYPLQLLALDTNVIIVQHAALTRNTQANGDNIVEAFALQDGVSLWSHATAPTYGGNFIVHNPQNNQSLFVTLAPTSANQPPTYVAYAVANGVKQWYTSVGFSPFALQPVSNGVSYPPRFSSPDVTIAPLTHPGTMLMFVAATSGSPELGAFDVVTAKQRWGQPVSLNVPPTLAVSGDLVLLTSAANLTSYAASDGTVRWKYSLAEPANTAVPMVPFNDLIIVAAGNQLVALSLANGQPRWSQQVAATFFLAIAIA